MEQKNILTLAILAAGIMQIGVAQATVFAGTATGSWTNVVSTDLNDVYLVNNNDTGGTAKFNWGTPATTTFDNQFEFNGIGSDAGPDWSASDETAFLIGDFSYRNGSTFNSVGINGVDLSIDLSINIPLSLSKIFSFDLTIFGTPNTTGDPVLDGDIVTVASTVSSTAFDYLGTSYTLELLGFSTDSGATITTSFNSPEGTTASAGVYGRITQSVPEPSMLALMGIGLLGFKFRKKAH